MHHLLLLLLLLSTVRLCNDSLALLVRVHVLCLLGLLLRMLSLLSPAALLLLLPVLPWLVGMRCSQKVGT